MKLFTFLLIGILFPLFAFGQTTQTKQIKFQLAPKTIQTHKDIKNLLKIAPDNTLKVVKQSQSYDIQHTRYEQYHEGHRIIGSSFVVHAKPQNEITINGQWIANFSRKGTATISKEAATKKAILTCKDDSQYYWEIPALEKQLQQSNSARSSYYPNPKLVWYDRKFSTNPDNYLLAYEMDIYSYQPRARYKIYIDAQSGKLLHKYNNMHLTNVPATGTGFHNGEIEFTTDSVGVNQFLLQEHNRHGHTNIFTFNINGEDIIKDANNKWTETGEEENKVAIDVHWSLEKSIDFYQEQFGRSGMDNMGRDVIAYVHHEDATAYYDGESINLGDGNANEGITALTSLNIVAHEFTHGVTESEANLIYAGESGGINESMSDIFGATIEHAVRPSTFNWTLGEEINYPFRQMNDPKSVGQPSTYQGENWDVDGDVHALSAIGNLWYFLIVEGGTGINDHGHTYDISSIGFDKAKTIVYEALTNYLTESSDYQNFRDVTLEITNNLYGNCAAEYHAVADAWLAVGVGEELRNNDLAITEISHPKTACNLALESIEVKLKYQSCPDTLPIGSTIKMYYSINSQTPIVEDFITTQVLYNEQYINYTFDTKADFSADVDYEIKVWHENLNDSHTPNNTAITNIKNRSNIGQDLILLSTKGISTFQCTNELNQFVINIKHVGCESIAAGTEIPVVLSLGDLSQNITLTTTELFDDGDSIFFTLTPTLMYGATIGNEDLSIEVLFSNDIDVTNNKLSRTLSFVEPQSEISPYLFKTDTDIDRLNVERGEFVQLSSYPLELIEHVFDYSLLISGGDYFGMLSPNFEEPESAEDVWNTNKGFITNVCMCVDATTWDSVILDFDMQQQAAVSIYEYIGVSDPSLFCNMRLKIDGTVISPTYHPDLNNSSYHHEQYTLNEYAGSIFNLCFESQNIVPSFFGDDGDELKLDNIFIRAHAVVDNNNPEKSQLKISAFPNPTKDDFELQLTLNGSQSINYLLSNTNGQALLTGQFLATGHHSEKIDLTGIPTGVYYLKVQSKLDSKVIRVVKAL